MLIDFRQQQQARFEQVAQRLQQAAAEGLQAHKNAVTIRLASLDKK